MMLELLLNLSAWGSQPLAGPCHMLGGPESHAPLCQVSPPLGVSSVTRHASLAFHSMLVLTHHAFAGPVTPPPL